MMILGIRAPPVVSRPKVDINRIMLFFYAANSVGQHRWTVAQGELW